MKRVLVADDEEGMRDLLEATLTRKGFYEVLLAGDGDEALSITHQESPDLILLDVMMPKRDGYEVCRAVQRDTLAAHIRVIMLTGLAQHVDKRRATEAGADAYITKPFNQAAILQLANCWFRCRLWRYIAPSFSPEGHTTPLRPGDHRGISHVTPRTANAR